jgi:membrane-bound ClpP family serine protease
MTLQSKRTATIALGVLGVLIFVLSLAWPARGFMMLAGLTLIAAAVVNAVMLRCPGCSAPALERASSAKDPFCAHCDWDFRHNRRQPVNEL